MRISMLLATLTVAGSLSAAISNADAAGVKNAAGPFAVGAQYDTTHVYVDPAKVDDFVASFVGAFGGQSTKQVVVTVTPTPSTTTSQLIQTPVGTVSLFGFKTPIPYPFGQERTGYLVKDLDKAVAAARKAGANVVVAPFPDRSGVMRSSNGRVASICSSTGITGRRIIPPSLPCRKTASTFRPMRKRPLCGPGSPSPEAR